jgi:hypothetical protein
MHVRLVPTQDRMPVMLGTERGSAWSTRIPIQPDVLPPLLAHTTDSMPQPWPVECAVSRS